VADDPTARQTAQIGPSLTVTKRGSRYALGNGGAVVSLTAEELAALVAFADTATPPYVPANETPSPWYLATCQQCTPRLPMPFSGETDASIWAWGHIIGTGHQVLLSAERRSGRG
jgi:hypothetical protein